jgi:hypothetical protein
MRADAHQKIKPTHTISSKVRVMSASKPEDVENASTLDFPWAGIGYKSPPDWFFNGGNRR